MTSRRVAVTGVSLLTGQGLNTEEAFAGIVAGKSVARRFTLFDPSTLASPFGVQLPDEADALFKSVIKPRRRKQMTRGTMLAVIAAKMALKSAGLSGRDEGETQQTGVVIGATGTGYAPQTETIDNHRILRNMASAPAAWITLTEKITGPAWVVSTACSSGAYALHSAMNLILGGECDTVVSGAADSALSFLDIQGFCSLMALSDSADQPATASRPFDKNRNGFVMGEGAGMLVLESFESARRRSAPILAELSLPGLVSESYNIMSPRQDGSGMVRCMERALENAGLHPEDIDYINAHGTSTILNDVCETAAIKTVFGSPPATPPISSTKSSTGHCLSAAAGVEAALCVCALQQNIIPPTINLTQPDPECDLDYTPHTARPRPLRHIMSNSFAFGGHNGACIFSRHE